MNWDGFTLRFGPTDQIKMSSVDCLKGLYEKFGCLKSVSR